MSLDMLLIPFSLSLLLNIAIIFIAKKYQFFIDENTSNKPQRFHNLPIPRAGGIGIFIPFSLSLLLLSLQSQDPLLQGLLWGGGIVFLSGIIEDFNASVSPKLRLLLQCLGGGIFIFLSGEFLNDLGFGITLPSYLGIPFSLFAIVGIINAINIIDGFNGLASGIALMALICMASLLPSSLSLSIICILIGSILGFWLLNFPWGKIFLGDGGAYFLGFVLASMLIHLTQDSLGGGGKRDLSVVWNHSSDLSLLGSGVFNLSSDWQSLSIASRQSPFASMPLSLFTTQNKMGQSPYLPSSTSACLPIYDSLPSLLSKPSCTSSVFSNLHSLLPRSISQNQIKLISPWFGITLLIYPFWEVVFSIYRKKFLRGISPMQPDKLHLHMLIYKRITKDNAKTTLFIFLCIFPFMFFATFFAYYSWILCLLSASFIGGYLCLYRKITKFQLWQLRQIFKNSFFKFLRRTK